MVTKWTKIRVCNNCEGTLFEHARYRWDWNDKSVESHTCRLCGSIESRFVKGRGGDLKLDVIEANDRGGFGIVTHFIERLLPSEVGDEMLKAGLRTRDRLAGKPYNSGDWATGMIVPTPPNPPYILKGGWQATGLRPNDLKEKGWRDDFTHEEYKKWRRTLKEGSQVEPTAAPTE